MSGHLARIEKQGYLTKQGKTVRNWRKRWIILKNSHLHYFKNKDVCRENLSFEYLITLRSSGILFLLVYCSYLSPILITTCYHILMLFPNIFHLLRQDPAPLDSIPLSDCSISFAAYCETKKRSCLKLLAPKRTWFFAAGNYCSHTSMNGNEYLGRSFQNDVFFSFRLLSYLFEF